jgi:hypothetical protein
LSAVTGGFYLACGTDSQQHPTTLFYPRKATQEQTQTKMPRRSQVMLGSAIYAVLSSVLVILREHSPIQQHITALKNGGLVSISFDLDAGIKTKRTTFRTLFGKAPDKAVISTTI